VVELHPPDAVQNQAEDILVKATAERKAAIAAIPSAERFAYACAFWHRSEGMDILFKDFLPELTQQLQTVPVIKLRGLQHASNAAGQIPDGEYTARFSQYSYLKQGEERIVPSVAIVIDGKEKQFGSINDRSMHLPQGTLVQAQIRSEGNVAYMQVRELLEQPESLAREISEALAESCNQTHPLQPLMIVTDGACSGNPGPGGWGAILVQGDVYRELGGGVLETTNNRMEMMAGIEALKYARANGMVELSTPITIISDSQLFSKGATGEWKRKANLDLWNEYDQVAAGLNIQFEWVKGHSGHELNEQVDAIATSFAQGRGYDAESLTAAESVMQADGRAGLDLSVIASSEQPTYTPSRSELLEWLAVAKAVGSAEQQETIKALGLSLREHYSREQGGIGLAPPLDYRHPAVVIDEQAYLQMNQAVAQLRASLSQVQFQQSARIEHELS
jgi:ribonuclease HI